AEDRADGPRSDGGTQRLVIARDSGEATLWPGLPVGEVIRRFEEEYGRAEQEPEAAPAPPGRVDLNQASFVLSPAGWLREAADGMRIPDGREDAAAGAAAGAGDGGTGDGTGGGSGGGVGSAPAVPAPSRATEVPAAGSAPAASSTPPPAPSPSPAPAAGSGTAWPAAGGGDEPADAVP